MIVIILKGYMHEDEDSTDDLQIIEKDVQLPALPRIGEELFLPEIGTHLVEAVWHDISKQRPEVHFRATGQELRWLVENYGFHPVVG